MSKGTPSTPDYNQAAQTQAASSREVTEQQTVANRPDIYTPFGSQTWSMTPTLDPVTGQMVSQWSQNTTLTPEMQQALDAQQNITNNKSQTAQALLGQFDQQALSPQQDYTPFLSTPSNTTTNMNPSASAYDKNAADASYNSFMNYNKPLMDQATSQLDTQLQNQGLKPGDAAYDTAMNNLRNQQSQATQQATYGAIATGNQVGQAQATTDLASQQQAYNQSMSGANYQAQLRQNEIADDLQQKGFTLNQINAILNGQQVGLPQTPGFTSAQGAQGQQALQASQLTGQSMLDQYNAQQQQQAGTYAGIGTVALTALSMY